MRANSYRPAWKAVQPKHDPQAWDVVTESGGIIAKLVWGHESAANARLMAAAPRLLRTLQEIVSDPRHVHEGTNALADARELLKELEGA